MVNDKCLSDVGMIKAFQTFACTNNQTEEPVNESSLIHYASRNSRLDTHSQLQGEEADELSLLGSLQRSLPTATLRCAGRKAAGMAPGKGRWAGACFVPLRGSPAAAVDFFKN